MEITQVGVITIWAYLSHLTPLLISNLDSHLRKGGYVGISRDRGKKNISVAIAPQPPFPNYYAVDDNDNKNNNN